MRRGRNSRKARCASFEKLHFVEFLVALRRLPAQIRELADKNYELLKANPRHPSLQLKRIDELWSVRVGQHYRALGIDVDGGIQWICIGSHADYDKFIG